MLSKLPKCIHNSIYARTAKSMKQFFYNIAATPSVRKQVLFVIHNNVINKKLCSKNEDIAVNEKGDKTDRLIFE